MLFKKNKWEILAAELARSLFMLQEEVRILEADARVKTNWLRQLLEKDPDYMANKSTMSEPQREILDAIMNPTPPEDEGTEGGLTTCWSPEDFRIQRARLYSLIEDMVHDK